MLRTRLDKAAREGRRVTGGDVASWLGVSQRTGRRRLADLLTSNPDLAQRITPPVVAGWQRRYAGARLTRS